MSDRTGSDSFKDSLPTLNCPFPISTDFGAVLESDSSGSSGTISGSDASSAEDAFALEEEVSSIWAAELLFDAFSACLLLPQSVSSTAKDIITISVRGIAFSIVLSPLSYLP